MQVQEVQPFGGESTNAFWSQSRWWFQYHGRRERHMGELNATVFLLSIALIKKDGKMISKYTFWFFLRWRQRNSSIHLDPWSLNLEVLMKFDTGLMMRHFQFPIDFPSFPSPLYFPPQTKMFSFSAFLPLGTKYFAPGSIFCFPFPFFLHKLKILRK